MRVEAPKAMDQLYQLITGGMRGSMFAGSKTGELFFFFFSFSSHLSPMDLIITILPVVTKGLPISLWFTPYIFFIAMQVQHSYNSSTNG